MEGRRLVAAIAASALLVGLGLSRAGADQTIENGIVALGDGKISDAPRPGHVFSCLTRFGGGGANRSGEWIHGATWDRNAKATVDGEIDWPNARIDIAVEGERRVIRANNLPTHPTGTFPIHPSDDAYSYDRNPNQIREQNILLTLPATPRLAPTATCVPMGMIGFASSGVAIYNALDGMGRDAPAHEIQDTCGGHPQRSGQYHYHDHSGCLADASGAAGRHSDLVGYALDGFGIYGLHGENGGILFSADLDACHGHTHAVLWDDGRRDIYHYHMTPDYPYTLGCFRGDIGRPAMRTSNGDAGPAPGGPRLTGPGEPGAGGGPQILEFAAAELGVDIAALRRAVGPPPPDFRRASQMLGLSEAKLRRAMRNAHDRAMMAPTPIPN